MTPIPEECKKVLDLLFELRRRAYSYESQGQHQDREQCLRLINTLIEGFDDFLDHDLD